MVPAILLEIEPHHFVLDICAAPGSKSLQAVEYVNKNSKRTEISSTGLVIANDLDPTRSYVLPFYLLPVTSYRYSVNELEN